MVADPRTELPKRNVTGSVSINAVSSSIPITTSDPLDVTGSVSINSVSGSIPITGSVSIVDQPIAITGSVSIVDQPIQTTQANGGALPTRIFRYLDTDGDGAGTTNAVGDYSSTADIFYIQPTAGQVFRIERLLIFLRGAKNRIKYDWYVENSAISNGITIRVQDNSGTVIDFTNGIPVKKIFDYMRICCTTALITEELVNSDRAGGATLSFSKASGFPIRLSGDDNERLEIVLNDDFSSLDEHYFMAQGYIED